MAVVRNLLILATVALLLGIGLTHITTITAEDMPDPPGPSSRAERTVGQGQTYTTISAAVSAATSGDTIRIYDGTYNENLLITKQLTFIGNGTKKTYVNGGSLGTAFEVDVAGCAFQDIAFRADGVTFSQAALKIDSTNNIVESCDFTAKCGIYATGDNGNQIKNSTFTGCNWGSYLSNSRNTFYYNNTYTNNNYGIMIVSTSSASNTITGNTFSMNVDGIYTSFSTQIDIENNTFDNNTNGMRLHTSDHNNVENNTHVDDHGAIVLSNSEYCNLHNNNMIGCGIWLTGSSFDWQRTTIYMSNKANGKPVYFRISEPSHTVPPGMGQIMMYGCADVTIDGQDVSNASVGINMYLCQRAIVKNTVSNDNTYGAYLYFGYGSRFTDCFFNDSEEGIHLYYADNVVIEDSVFNRSEVGVQTIASEDMFLFDNDFYGCGVRLGGWGLEDYNTHIIPNTNMVNSLPLNYVVNMTSVSPIGTYGQVIMANCDLVTLTDQDLSNTTDGITIAYSTNVKVKTCTTSDCLNGIRVFQSTYSLIEDSVIDRNVRGIDASGYSSYTTIRRATGAGNDEAGIFIDRQSTNAMIENCVLKDTNGPGIQLSDGTGASGSFYSEVWNCTVTNSITGIHLDNHAEWNVVENCTLESNNRGMVVRRYAHNSYIGNCSFTDNWIGVLAGYFTQFTNFSYNDMDNDIYDVFFDDVTDMELHANTMTKGVFMTGISQSYFNSHEISKANTVNTKPLLYIADMATKTYSLDAGQVIVAACTDITVEQLNVSGASNAIFMAYSNFCEISNNTFNANVQGIYVWGSNRNIITNNHFADQDGYAINVDNTAQGNRVYHNNFISNNPGFTQALCNGTTNWNRTASGNHWDDWVTPDTEPNGIVDDPYDLDGSVDNKDHFPLVDFYGKPYIVTPPKTIAHEDHQYSVEYEAADPNTQLYLLEFGLDTNASWLQLLSNDTLWGKPTNDDIGTYYVNITVTDGVLHNYQYFMLTVLNTNDDPYVTTVPSGNAVEDELYRITFDATDPDPGLTEFSWSVDDEHGIMEINQTSGELTGTPTNDHVGTMWVNVTVSDNLGGTGWLLYDLNVTDSNDPPFWIDIPDSRVMEIGESFNFTVKADDMDIGDNVQYAIRSTPHSSVTISAFSGKLDYDAQDVGFFVLNLSATDGVATIYYEFNVTVEKGNNLPIANLITPVDEAIIEVVNPTLTWETLDEDGDHVTVDIYMGDLMSGVQLKYPTYLVAEDVGTDYYSIETELTPGETYYWTVFPHDGIDEGTCSDGVQSFTISDEAVFNNPPRFISKPGLEAQLGKQWSYTPMAVDDDGEATIITYRNGPWGMEYLNGTLTWTPQVLGNFSVTLQVTDGTNIVMDTFTVTVLTIVAPNTNPVITPIRTKEITEEDLIEFQIEATDADNDTLTFDMNGPPRSTLTEDGYFSWQTEWGDNGTHEVVVFVSDGRGGQASLTITIVVFEGEFIGTNNTGGNTTDGGDGGDTQDYTGLLIIVLILVIVAILAAVGVIILVRMRAKDQPVDDGIDHYAIAGAEGEVDEGVSIEKSDIFDTKKKSKAEGSGRVIEQDHIAAPPVAMADLPPEFAEVLEKVGGETPENATPMKVKQVDDKDTIASADIAALPAAGMTYREEEKELSDEELEAVELKEITPEDMDEDLGYTMPEEEVSLEELEILEKEEE